MVRKTETKKKDWFSWIKENVGWLVGLITIAGAIFSLGRWTASLEYKAASPDRVRMSFASSRLLAFSA